MAAQKAAAEATVLWEAADLWWKQHLRGVDAATATTKEQKVAKQKAISEEAAEQQTAEEATEKAKARKAATDGE